MIECQIIFWWRGYVTTGRGHSALLRVYWNYRLFLDRRNELADQSNVLSFLLLSHPPFIRYIIDLSLLSTFQFSYNGKSCTLCPFVIFISIYLVCLCCFLVALTVFLFSFCNLMASIGTIVSFVIRVPF
jgi:hypothetical protein